MLKSTLITQGNHRSNPISISPDKMQQRGTDRNRPFKQYNPNPVEFDTEGNPLPAAPPQQSQSQPQGQPLQGQSLFDFDDSNLLSILGSPGQGMNPDMLRGGMQAISSQGMPQSGNGMPGMPQPGMNSISDISQPGGILSTTSVQSSSSMSLPPPSTTSSSSGDMYAANFLMGTQDQDMASYLTGITPSLQLQGGGMRQQSGGMMSQQTGSMVLGGRGMGQMDSNGPQMPPMQYPTNMNMSSSYNSMKLEKNDDMYPNSTASSSTSTAGENTGNGNRVSSPDSPHVVGSSSIPGSPAKSNASRDDGDSGVEGDGSAKSNKKRQSTIPEEQKDEAYWEKRRKNNESAKRSREARRLKEEQIAMRVVVLEQENLALKTEIGILKTEVDNLRHMLYNTPPPPPNHM